MTMQEKINWTVFDESSHCVEGLAFFAVGHIKTFKEFERWFGPPGFTEQRAEVRKMKGRGLEKMRQAAARAFRRNERGSIIDLYGADFVKAAKIGLLV